MNGRPDPVGHLPAAILNLVAYLYTGERVGGAQTLSTPVGCAPTSLPSLASMQRLTEQVASGVVLDRLPFGIVAVDATCRLQFANEPGRRALDASDPLVQIGDCVRPWAEADRLAFAHAAETACLGAVWPVEGRDLVIARRNAPLPVRLLAARVGQPPAAFLALLVPDADRTQALRRLLKTMFGLTTAEAHVALLMMEGLSLDRVARRRGITLHATREQWQAARWKVGTNADAAVMKTLQAALLLPLVPGGLRGDSDA